MSVVLVLALAVPVLCFAIAFILWWLERRPAIITYRPGVPSSQRHVATWREVQEFVTAKKGKIIVYVDDSAATCHIPAESGVTDGSGHLELRSHRQTK